MDFLYVITKQEFTALYRFGDIPGIKERIIKLKELTENKVENCIENLFLKSLPYFVGDEEYLFISLNKYPDNKICIENVLEIIPLTEKARSSFQRKFNKKIVFSEARYEKIINKIQEKIDIDERIKGAEAFWELCKIDESLKEFQKSLKNDLEIIKKAKQKRIEGKHSYEFQDDFFVHTLAYDRFEMFPKSKLGYFYDVGEIFAHMNGLRTFKNKKSEYYQFLEKYKTELSNKKLSDIIIFFEEDQEFQKLKLKSKLTTEKGLRKYLVAVLFFEFKDLLNANASINETNIPNIVKPIYDKYKEELCFAIYLTGLYFGYEKFYDDLYSLKGLHIFEKTSGEPTKKPNYDELINKINELIKKNGGKIQVKNEAYKEIKELVKQNSNSDIKNKKQCLIELKKLTRGSFDININKAIIKKKKIGNQIPVQFDETESTTNVKQTS